MARIEIPEHLRSKIGADMKMDIHWIDVQLNNGTKIFNLVVRGGRYITGKSSGCQWRRHAEIQVGRNSENTSSKLAFLAILVGHPRYSLNKSQVAIDSVAFIQFHNNRQF